MAMGMERREHTDPIDEKEGGSFTQGPTTKTENILSIVWWGGVVCVCVRACACACVCNTLVPSFLSPISCEGLTLAN